MNKTEHKHLPRLKAPHYRGFAVVHWTMAIRDRQRGWLTSENHERMREVLVQTMVRYELLCPAYCLMPDHVHVMWMGVAESSDQLSAVRSFRRHTAALLKPYSWQKQAYDHVLREEDRKRGAFADACRYIMENPVRAGLCESWSDYACSGACVPEDEVDPRVPDYWERFWEVYATCRERAESARVGDGSATLRTARLH